jgi:hypothetical protein
VENEGQMCGIFVAGDEIMPCGLYAPFAMLMLAWNIQSPRGKHAELMREEHCAANESSLRSE